MGFFVRLSKSYQLLKDSYAFLKNNKDLIILPLISTVATLTFFACVFFYGVISGTSIKALNAASFLVKIVGLGAFNFLLSCVVIFFNTALVVAATMRLRGQECSVSTSLKIACGHWDKIIAWSFVSVTVGFILRSLERSPLIIRGLVGFLAGAAWAMASFFVIPMLVFEQVGPIEALRRGGKLFVGNWRKTISVNMVLFFVLLPIYLLIMLLFDPVATATGSIVFATILMLSIFIPLGIVTSTFDTIVTCALYLKLRHDQTPKAFRGGLLDEIFERKQ